MPGSSAEMTVSVTDQALFFAGALVMGAAVGLLYDAFRILRVRVRLPLLGGVLDLLFWLVVTVALFVYTTTAGSGEVRLYIVAAVLLGAAAYFWLLSRWFLKLGYRLADLVGVLWRVLTLPVVFLLRLCKKIGKTAKKSFHYRRKWYRIRLISREMDELHRSDRRASGGGTACENQKSVPPDQAGGTGPAYWRRHRAAGPAPADGPPERPGEPRRRAAQKQVNADLSDAVENSDDPDRQADIARGKLGLVEPGEYIFRFTD
ncbi:MAG: spore cortex biosynthesis protein YabQ [Flavonifractor plautii]